MHEGNLEDKGWISLLHEQWGKYEVYIPWENKRIRGDHGITYNNTMIASDSFVLTGNLICNFPQTGVISNFPLY